MLVLQLLGGWSVFFYLFQIPAVCMKDYLTDPFAVGVPVAFVLEYGPHQNE